MDKRRCYVAFITHHTSTQAAGEPQQLLFMFLTCCAGTAAEIAGLVYVAVITLEEGYGEFVEAGAVVVCGGC